MKAQLALKALGEIMQWDDSRAQTEFQWLRLMARLKYDAYEDFRAGARFIESLVTWLQQFDQEDREPMYEIVRRRIIYFGGEELQRLVDLFYPRTLEKRLVKNICKKFNIPPFRFWVHAEAVKEFRKQLRKTLIMALSDGARIDQLRRATYGLLVNDQFVGMTQVDEDKWDELLKELRKDLGDPSARFSHVVLVDDFMGTGSTILRNESGEWKGRLPRFRKTLNNIAGLEEKAFEPEWTLQVHHYLALPRSNKQTEDRARKARTELGEENWFPNIDFTYELGIPDEFSLAKDSRFVGLSKKYYNSSVETDSTRKSGFDNMSLGYGECGLPVVIGHNTPNNSVPLLWYECDARVVKGVQEPEMRPLFRRRQRHIT